MTIWFAELVAVGCGVGVGDGDGVLVGAATSGAPEDRPLPPSSPPQEANDIPTKANTENLRTVVPVFPGADCNLMEVKSDLR